MRALAFSSILLVPLVSGCGPKVPQEVEDLQEFSLAYPTDALDSGGQVLMLDGAIHQMAADELKGRLDSQPARQANGSQR